MNSLVPYLIFSGTCRDAMERYRDILGGEIVIMQTYGESPIPATDGDADRIFNSELRAGNICIKASDDLPSHPVTAGSNVCLFVDFPDEETKSKAFDGLAEGGKVLFPISENFGMLEDRFGIRWMVVHGGG